MTLIQCSHGIYLSSIEIASLRICSTLVYNGFMSPKIGDLEEIILVAIHKSISVEVLTGGLKQGQPPHTPVKDLGFGLRSQKNHCTTDIIHQSWIFHRKLVELKYSFILSGIHENWKEEQSAKKENYGNYKTDFPSCGFTVKITFLASTTGFSDVRWIIVIPIQPFRVVPAGKKSEQCFL